jgi:hypothetical protein
MSKINELRDFSRSYPEPEDLQWSDTALENMQSLLESYGFQDAAKETYETLLVVRAHRNRLGVLIDRLWKIWDTVGYISTGDSTRDQLDVPICEYRTGLRLEVRSWRSKPGRNVPIYCVRNPKISGKESLLAKNLEEKEALEFAYEYAAKQPYTSQES